MIRKKQILIVDDEKAILAVLTGALKKSGDVYQVTTALDGFSALDRLKENTFDLVVTDFNMEGMDGLELVEAIRFQQPQSKIIMITAFGYDGLESDASRLAIFRYLTKPLEIGVFRQVIQEALAETAISRPDVQALSEEQYQTIHKLLNQLQIDVSARCIFLTNPAGQTILRIGDAGKIAVEKVASLVGGSIAALLEAGQVLDEQMENTTLVYREGKNETMYALNVGAKMLLILIIDRGQYSSRLGSVWYYAQQVATNLQQLLSKSESRPKQGLKGLIDQAFDDELDKILSS